LIIQRDWEFSAEIIQILRLMIDYLSIPPATYSCWS